jgi:hypothetical protein
MKLQQEQELEHRSIVLEPAARPTAKKRRDPGKCLLGALMMLAGVVSFFHITPFTPFPFNLVAGATAILLGAAVTSAWQCGYCRARTDRDAKECPRCGAPFSRA